jgi:hypothetical protein
LNAVAVTSDVSVKANFVPRLSLQPVSQALKQDSGRRFLKEVQPGK